jgi:hypothetical protein
MPAKAKKKKPVADDGPVMTDAEHEKFNLVQNVYAEQMEQRRVGLLEDENQTLRTIAKELRLRLDKQVQSQTELITYLKGKISERNVQINQLQESNATLLEEKNTLVSDMEQSRLVVEKDTDVKMALKDKMIAELTEKYNRLIEFKGQKLEMHAKLRALEEEVKEERIKHVEHVAALDRRNMMQKDRLKNEMLRKIRETKLSLLAMTEDQLHTTTKRTIMENEQITTELQYQSRETERIIRRNNKLEAQNKAMRRQMELAKDSQVMLAKRTHFYHKLITRLNDKLKSVEEDNAVLKSQCKQPGAKKVADATVSQLEKYKRLDTYSKELEETIKNMQVENHDLVEQVEEARRTTERMLELQDDACTFILTCVEEVKAIQSNRKTKSGNSIMGGVLEGGEADPASDSKRWKLGNPIPASLTGVSPDERREILELLFQKLNYFDETQAETLFSSLNRTKPKRNRPPLEQDSREEEEKEKEIDDHM